MLRPLLQMLFSPTPNRGESARDEAQAISRTRFWADFREGQREADAIGVAADAIGAKNRAESRGRA